MDMKIVAKGKDTSITINGREISDMVQRVTFERSAGSAPVVILRLIPAFIEIETDAVDVDATQQRVFKEARDGRPHT